MQILSTSNDGPLLGWTIVLKKADLSELYRIPLNLCVLSLKTRQVYRDRNNTESILFFEEA